MALKLDSNDSMESNENSMEISLDMVCNALINDIIYELSIELHWAIRTKNYSIATLYNIPVAPRAKERQSKGKKTADSIVFFVILDK